MYAFKTFVLSPWTFGSRLNQIWMFSGCPMLSGIVQIAAYIATCSFNESMQGVLTILNVMKISCSLNVHNYAGKENASRVQISDRRA